MHVTHVPPLVTLAFARYEPAGHAAITAQLASQLAAAALYFPEAQPLQTPGSAPLHPVRYSPAAHVRHVWQVVAQAASL